MSPTKQRKTYLIDREVQGTLLSKAAWYWLLSVAIVGALNIVGWIFIAPGAHILVQIREQLPSLFGTLVVATLSSLIVLPVLLLDLAKHTNRFAGPIFRLQRSMKDLADGKATGLVEFREGDYWQELAESFNRVVARLEEAERQISDASLEFDTVPTGSRLEEAASS